MTCTCGHPDRAHVPGLGCFAPYRGMRDDRGLCTCPTYTTPCNCPGCERDR